MVHLNHAREISGCYGSKFAAQKALNLVERNKLTLDERVVVHRVVLTYQARTILVCAEERCPPRQKSKVERLKAKVEPLLT